MICIEFDNGVVVTCPEKVESVDNVIRMPRAEIGLNGLVYEVTDLVINLSDGIMSYPRPNGERTEWVMK